MNYNEGGALVICREFGCRDDANAWRKLTKEADKHKIFYCNLESKNLSMHLHHHCTNSHQSSSGWLITVCKHQAKGKTNIHLVC